jgi:hypothetical protein
MKSERERRMSQSVGRGARSFKVNPQHSTDAPMRDIWPHIPCPLHTQPMTTQQGKKSRRSATMDFRNTNAISPLTNTLWLSRRDRATLPQENATVEDTKRTRWMGCLSSRRATGSLGHLSLSTHRRTPQRGGEGRGGTDRMGHTTQCTHPPTHFRRLFGAQRVWWEGEWAEETVPQRDLRQLRLQTWWCGWWLVLVVWRREQTLLCVCVCVSDLEFLSDWSDSSFHTRDRDCLSNA